MTRVAIIGGIGSGKTAVTDYLAHLGAGVVDADEIARDVVRPGMPAWCALRDAFGDAILLDDGTLDRAFVATVVFHDAAALRRLNHITHGAIGLEMVTQVTSFGPDTLVAVALPLYRPLHRELLGLDEVWCVWVEPELAITRLVEQRGFTREDAEARIAAQVSNHERLALADHDLENAGSLIDLHRGLDALLKEKGLLGA